MDCLAGSSVLPVVSSHHIDQVIVAREPSALQESNTFTDSQLNERLRISYIILRVDSPLILYMAETYSS